MLRNGILLVLAGTVFVATGTPVAHSQGAPAVTSDEVLQGLPLGVTGDPSTSIPRAAVLALSDEMRDFLGEHVNPGATATFKLQQLIDAIMGTGDFKLEYDENTRTAAETFRLRRGNCLSFTTLFVALARGAGLVADFQEVDIPPDWSTRDDVFVLNLHVNARVDLGSGGSRAVDFNIGDFKSTFEVETIPDRRAVAHFFNNMGVERMQAGEVADAFAFFRRAILETDGDFSPAWTNLGLLYRKAGHLEHAEAAYLQALQADKDDVVAMSNLVSLYGKRGDQEASQRFQRRVDEHRMRNPHLRYTLAREAFYAGDYDAAIDHLKFATRRVKDEDRFYFLLGLCYLMQGDQDRADKWTAKARQVATDEAQRERYSRKLAVLTQALRRPR